MNAAGLRRFCLSLPHATEGIKWEHHLCFMLAEKMFAVANIEPTEDHFVAVKTTPERAAELIEIESIIPTPYMARNHWVTLQRGDVLRDSEIEDLIRGSYELVMAKLPKRMQAKLQGGQPTKANAATKTRKKSAKKKRSSSR
jgi:predicted DNA-binding protein (MmcQ/YjbR family)